MKISIDERFWSKVDMRTEDECWEWMAYRNPAGYGCFMLSGRPHRAHRVAYEMLVAPIPGGLVLDHLCRNKGCVNPRHLEPVTPGENTRRGDAYAALASYWDRLRNRTHCKNGHPFDSENVYTTPAGYRTCRKCRLAAHARWRGRNATHAH